MFHNLLIIGTFTPLLLRLDKSNSTGISLVYYTNFVRIFVTEYIKVMVNIIKSEDGLLNRDWSAQVKTDVEEMKSL